MSLPWLTEVLPLTTVVVMGVPTLGRDMVDLGFPSVSDFGGKSFNSQEVSELLGQ